MNDLSLIASGVWRGVNDAVEDDTGGRQTLCETAGAVFGCAGVAHVRLDVDRHCWSMCLWRHTAPDHPTCIAEMDPAMRGDALDEWWAVSVCRQTALSWIAGPHLIEVPLSDATPSIFSILILGRDDVSWPDMRLVTVVLRQIAVVGRTELPLERFTQQLPSDAVTNREAEVLRLLSAGLIARSIAHQMSVSERTVHKHLEHLYHKLDVHDRLSAVIRAQQLGILDPLGIS